MQFLGLIKRQNFWTEIILFSVFQVIVQNNVHQNGQQNGQHTPTAPNEQNSVKLNNEIPKDSKNVAAEEGISYNLTGKLKTLGDMIINETSKKNQESVGKFSIPSKL